MLGSIRAFLFTLGRILVTFQGDDLTVGHDDGQLAAYEVGDLRQILAGPAVPGELVTHCLLCHAEDLRQLLLQPGLHVRIHSDDFLIVLYVIGIKLLAKVCIFFEKALAFFVNML